MTAKYPQRRTENSSSEDRSYIEVRNSKKFETVACFISPLLKNRNPKCGTRNKELGVNKIDSFIKDVALETELDVERRKLTNHCEEAEGFKSAKNGAIIGVTGHTSRRSLADYEEGDEAEQRQISSIISSPVGQQVQNSRPVLSSLPFEHNCTATPAC